jgi:TonB family protein
MRSLLFFLALTRCLYSQLPDHGPAMDFEMALERLSENFGVRVGLEYRVSPVTSQAVRFPSHAATARAALTSIVGQVAGYRWRFEGDVAHVYEPGTVQDRRNWLNMSWTENPSAYEPFTTTQAISSILMQRVQARIRPDACGRGGIGGSFLGPPEGPPFKFQIREGTVRDYLNEIVRKTIARMWVVRFAEVPRVTTAGLFEVAGARAKDCSSPLWTLTSMRSVRGPNVVKHPIVLKRVRPSYSDEARQLKHEGSVVLVVDIDSTGKPAARVVRPLGLGLDEKAIEAVQRWRFRPVYDGGNPVPARTTVELVFRLPEVGTGNTKH